VIDRCVVWARSCQVSQGGSCEAVHASPAISVRSVVRRSFRLKLGKAEMPPVSLLLPCPGVDHATCLAVVVPALPDLI